MEKFIITASIYLIYNDIIFLIQTNLVLLVDFRENLLTDCFLKLWIKLKYQYISITNK